MNDDVAVVRLYLLGFFLLSVNGPTGQGGLDGFAKVEIVREGSAFRAAAAKLL